MKPLSQGWLDSLCGIYSLCNAYKITNRASENDVQEMFNHIIKYLSSKRMLKGVLLNGVYYKNMLDIMKRLVEYQFFQDFSNPKWTTGYRLKDFWEYSMEHLREPRSVIILSIGGASNHYTVVERMTSASMFLVDSSGMKRINRSQCRFYGYQKEDKYVLYPNECFYMKGR